MPIDPSSPKSMVGHCIDVQREYNSQMSACMVRLLYGPAPRPPTRWEVFKARLRWRIEVAREWLCERICGCDR